MLTTLGVSNVSFGLQAHARAVLNSVFLFHCVEAGLDTAIINPAHVLPYAEIPDAERELANNLIWDRREGDRDPLADFIAFYEGKEVETEATVDPTAEMTPEQALHWKILHRKKEGIEELIDLAVERNQAVPVLNTVLLPAMKEVGDKFGAGELILPFVLQSAEVMKKAVARLETYLEKAEGQTKGKVVLATVYGDVHDIGKNLVNTILTNNGYTVFDLGKQVPVNTIIEKALEVEADAIGLSALLVSTSKQMPLCAQELHRRGLPYPLLVGGAAINPSFVRAAAAVDGDELYGPGMFYCKDAFEGLATMDRLQDAGGRQEFVSAHNREMRERSERYAELRAKGEGMRPASRAEAAVPTIESPTPPFWGVKVLGQIPVDEVVACIDRNTLYRMQWGGKNLKGEEWERVMREEFEPRLDRYTREARTQGWLRPRAIYGYFPAGREGDELVVFDPANRAREIGRFEFPRQPAREQLCLADYFRPLNGRGPEDVVALQVVTSGDRAEEFIERRNREGDYSEGYYLHGFSVQTAEGAAEYVNRRVREELGIGDGPGTALLVGIPRLPGSRAARNPVPPDAGRESDRRGIDQRLAAGSRAVHRPRWWCITRPLSTSALREAAAVGKGKMVARRHRMDRALRTRRRGIWLATFAILLVGGGVLALALFSPARRWQRAVGRLAVGISAEQVERILGSPSVTCPPQGVGHLDRSFPAGWPAGAVRLDAGADGGRNSRALDLRPLRNSRSPLRSPCGCRGDWDQP